MNRNIFNTLAISIVISLIFTTCNPQKTSFTNPDNSLELLLSFKEGIPYYALKNAQGNKLIKPSQLGFSIDEIQNEVQLGSIQEEVSDLFNTIKVVYNTDSKLSYEIEFRIYNDALAYRYNFDTKETATILKENSAFSLPNGMAWIQPYDKVSQWSPGYEQYFEKVKLGEPSPNEEGWCFPILANTEFGWYYISEVGFERDYHLSHLETTSDSTYQIRFPEPTELNGDSNELAIQENITTPWRVIQVGSLKSLMEEPISKRLAEKPIGNYSWVKPGRAAWSWWSDHESSRQPYKMKAFIDLAAEMGWEYNLIDANWNTFSEDSLMYLVNYAKSKNVETWLWYNSGGPNNIITEAPRDKMHIDSVRKAEFEKLKAWGVTGIKIDFFQSDKAKLVNQYLDIIDDAEKYKLALNFHGATLPRGITTTYPHVLTLEAVRGAESYAFDHDTAWPDRVLTQNTVYPFTRNLSGDMDYTPVTLTKYPNARKTTDTHELALAVIFESRIQHLADSPEAYASLPQDALQYLKQVPVEWDETKFIDGMPGEFILLARKKGDQWYLAGINGTTNDKAVEVNLATYFEDDVILIKDIDGKLVTETINAEVSNINMEARGGFIVFEKGK